MHLQLLNEDNSTLNIFCDASILKLQDETYVGCAGATCIDFNNQDKAYTVHSILPQSTNNNSEISAILFGILEAIRNKNNYQTINLFSDSKICIFGLREWIFNWIRNIKHGVMYSTSDTPVANQDVISEIVYMIVTNNLYINLFHQKGHISLRNNKSLLLARRVFEVSNKIILDFEVVKIISFYNDYIDRYTGDKLNEYTNQVKLIRPAEFPITAIDMKKYKSLIKGNNG